MVIDINDNLLEDIKKELLDTLNTAETRVTDMFEYGEAQEVGGVVSALVAAKNVLIMLDERVAASLCDVVGETIQSANVDDESQGDKIAAAFLTLTQYVSKLSVTGNTDASLHQAKALLTGGEVVAPVYMPNEKKSTVLKQAVNKLKGITDNVGTESYWQQLYKITKITKEQVASTESYEFVWLVQQLSALNIRKVKQTSAESVSEYVNQLMRYLVAVIKTGERSDNYAPFEQTVVALRQETDSMNETLKSDYSPPSQTLIISGSGEILFPVSARTIEAIHFFVKKELATTKSIFETALNNNQLDDKSVHTQLKETLKGPRAVFRLLGFSAGWRLVAELDELLKKGRFNQEDITLFTRDIVLIEDALWQLGFLDKADLVDTQQAADKQQKHVLQMAVNNAKVVGANVAYTFFKSARDTLIENYANPTSLNMMRLAAQVHKIRAANELFGETKLAEQLQKTEQLHLFLHERADILTQAEVTKTYIDLLVTYEIIFEQLQSTIHLDQRALKLLEGAQQQFSSAVSFNIEQMSMPDYTSYAIDAGSASKEEIADTETPELSLSPDFDAEFEDADDLDDLSLADLDEDFADTDDNVGSDSSTDTQGSETAGATEGAADAQRGGTSTDFVYEQITQPSNLKLNEDVVSDSPDEVDEEILEIFIEEGQGIASELKENLAALKEDYFNKEIVGEIRRSFHTLKGSGRMVGLNVFGEFAWQHEEMLNRIINGDFEVNGLVHKQLTDALGLVDETVNSTPFAEKKDELLNCAARAEAIKNAILNDDIPAAAPEIAPTAPEAISLASPTAESSSTAVDDASAVPTVGVAPSGDASALIDSLSSADLDALADKMAGMQPINPDKALAADATATPDKPSPENDLEMQKFVEEVTPTVEASKDSYEGWEQDSYAKSASFDELRDNIEHINVVGKRVKYVYSKLVTQSLSDTLNAMADSNKTIEAHEAEPIKQALNELARIHQEIQEGKEGEVNPKVLASLEQVGENFSGEMPTSSTISKTLSASELSELGVPETFEDLSELTSVDAVVEQETVVPHDGAELPDIAEQELTAADLDTLSDDMAMTQPINPANQLVSDLAEHPALSGLSDEAVKAGSAGLRQFVKEIAPQVHASIDSYEGWEQDSYAKGSAFNELRSNIEYIKLVGERFNYIDNQLMTQSISDALRAMADSERAIESSEAAPVKDAIDDLARMHQEVSEGKDGEVNPEVLKSLDDVNHSFAGDFARQDSTTDTLTDTEAGGMPIDFSAAEVGVGHAEGAPLLEGQVNIAGGWIPDRDAEQGVNPYFGTAGQLPEQAQALRQQLTPSSLVSGAVQPDELIDSIYDLEASIDEGDAPSWAWELLANMENAVSGIQSKSLLPSQNDYKKIADALNAIENAENISEEDARQINNELMGVRTTLSTRQQHAQSAQEFTEKAEESLSATADTFSEWLSTGSKPDEHLSGLIAEIDNVSRKAEDTQYSEAQELTSMVKGLLTRMQSEDVIPFDPIVDTVQEALTKIAAAEAREHGEPSDNSELISSLQQHLSSPSIGEVYAPDMSSQISQAPATPASKDSVAKQQPQQLKEDTVLYNSFAFEAEPHIESSKEEFSTWQQTGFTDEAPLERLSDSVKNIQDISEQSNFQSAAELGQHVSDVLSRLYDDVVAPDVATATTVDNAIKEFDRASEAIANDDENKEINPDMIHEAQTLSLAPSLGYPLTFDERDYGEFAKRKESGSIVSGLNYQRPEASISDLENVDVSQLEGFGAMDSDAGTSNIAATQQDVDIDDLDLADLDGELADITPTADLFDTTAGEEEKPQADITDSEGIEPTSEQVLEQQLDEALEQSITETSEQAELPFSEMSADDLTSAIIPRYKGFAGEARPHISASKDHFANWEQSGFELEEPLDKLTESVENITATSKKHELEDATELGESVSEILSRLKGEKLKPSEETSANVGSAIEEFDRSATSAETGEGNPAIASTVIQQVKQIVSAEQLGTALPTAETETTEAPAVQTATAVASGTITSTDDVAETDKVSASPYADYAKNAKEPIVASQANYGQWKESDYNNRTHRDNFSGDVSDIRQASETHGYDSGAALGRSVEQILQRISEEDIKPNEESIHNLESALGEFERSLDAIESNSPEQEINPSITQSLESALHADVIGTSLHSSLAAHELFSDKPEESTEDSSIKGDILGEDSTKVSITDAKPTITLDEDLKSAVEAELESVASGAQDGVRSNDPGKLDEAILEIFLDEAKDITKRNDKNLQDWQKDYGNLSALQEIQRGMHTLKGGARMAELTVIGDLSHYMETLLDYVVDGQVRDKDGAHAMLKQGAGLTDEMIQQAASGHMIYESPEYLQALDEFVKTQTGKSIGYETLSAIEAATGKLPQADQPAATQTGDSKKKRRSYNLRVRSDLMDDLSSLVGEDTISRARLERNLTDHGFQLDELSRTIIRLSEQLRRLENETEAQILFKHETETAFQEDFDPLELDRFSEMQQLSRLLAESMEDLQSLRTSLSGFVDESKQILTDQTNIQRELQDGILSASLVRFDSVLPRFEKMVGQIADELGKHVEVQLHGGEIEIERNMLEDLIPGFEHTIRNCLAHGIEMPEDREKVGKPTTGVIRIGARREGAEISFVIADDGRGANLVSIRDKAKRLGILDHERANDKNYLLQLLFEPGFTTAKKANQLFGRGIGLDVLKDVVNARRGSIEVETEEHKGMATSIRMPFSMSITDALAVTIGHYTYAVPIMSIEGIARIPRDLYEPFALGQTTYYSYGQNRYKLESLIEFIDPYAEKTTSVHGIPALLVRVGSKRIAFEVQEISNRQEVIIKSVNHEFTSLPGVIGAAVLDSGQPVPVLEVAALGRQFLNFQETGGDIRDLMEIESFSHESTQTRVLVVDDSITMRKVSSKILGKYNVEVQTAKDGLDAIDVIGNWEPDLILLDIEMPRMDGFEFATHVRNDSEIRETPIIMITSRTGDKHRERAKTIGVNDYLGKPYTEEVLVNAIENVLDITLQK